MNESPKEHSYEAEVRVLTMDLEPVLSRKCSGVIPALSSADILSLDLPDELLQIPESVPDSLFGGTSTVQNFFLTDQEKGPSVAAPHISGDCLRRIPAPAAENCLIASTVRFDDGTVSESVETIVPYKHLALPKAGITAHVRESEDGSSFEILLQSDCFAAFAELDFDDADAVFSDNCFSMVRREPYMITLKKSDIRRGVFSDAADVERRLKIRSLRDTY